MICRTSCLTMLPVYVGDGQWIARGISGRPGPPPLSFATWGRIEAFNVGDRFGADLAYLVGLLAAGRLDPQVGWRGSWDRASEAAELLLGRQVRGKTVLEIAR